MTEPTWLTPRDLVVTHEEMIAAYGGLRGIRDLGLLKSACARPQQIYSYSSQWDLVTLASAYTMGIVKNHPFLDGNKRTGFTSGILFLDLNGVMFESSQDDATRAVLDLAAGTISEDEYSSFLREHTRLTN